MAHISAAENRTISEAFGSGTGYVMDFTNPTFDSFFRSDVGVQIYSEEFSDNGQSKGKRLHCFLHKTTDALAYKALKALWDYRQSGSWTPDYADPVTAPTLQGRMEALLERLKSGRREISALTQDPAEWLARLSQQCREISRAAIEAYDESAESKIVDDSNKRVMALLASQLEALLPEDFPPSTIYSLKRHIGFNERSDMHDIYWSDIPGIIEAAEKYVVGLKDQIDKEYDIRGLVDEIFLSKFNETIAQREPDFHGLVLSCAVRLSDRFKHRTGLADDDMGLIGRAFSPRDPILLAAPDLETETNRNFQAGAMHLLQGARAYFRNTHAHSVQPTDQETALRALILFSLCADILAGAKRTDEE